MKNLINTLAGGEKAATPAKKAVITAALITAAALFVCLVALAVSAAVFAIRDKDTPPDTDTDAGTAETAEPLVYYTASKDEMSSHLEAQVPGKTSAERAIGGDDMYYAYEHRNTVKLSSGTLDNSHNMLLDFAKAAALRTNIKADDCNIPLIADVTNGGASFALLTFGEDSTAGDGTYSWIYENAYKYGFIYEGDTFTYVGAAAARYARENGSLEALAAPAAMTVGGVKHQIYYIPADAESFNLPTAYEFSVFSISGGYVVTVNMSLNISE